MLKTAGMGGCTSSGTLVGGEVLIANASDFVRRRLSGVRPECCKERCLPTPRGRPLGLTFAETTAMGRFGGGGGDTREGEDITGGEATIGECWGDEPRAGCWGEDTMAA